MHMHRHVQNNSHWAAFIHSAFIFKVSTSSRWLTAWSRLSAGLPAPTRTNSGSNASNSGYGSNGAMLRMSPLISRHSQFLWVWFWVAAGASTAGLLEKDLERELSTFKYPAIFPAQKKKITQRVDARRGSEQRGGQALRSFSQYSELQHRPPPLPGGTRRCYVSGGKDSEEGLKEQRRGRLAWPFASFATFLMNHLWVWQLSSGR